MGRRDDRMCPYYDADRGVSVAAREREYHIVYPECEVRKLRRKRVTCPVCGRRMRGWVASGYDDELRYIVPQHKRKGWWKKRGGRSC